jgi:hypothetical protein
MNCLQGATFDLDDLGACSRVFPEAAGELFAADTTALLHLRLRRSSIKKSRHFRALDANSFRKASCPRSVAALMRRYRARAVLLGQSIVTDRGDVTELPSASVAVILMIADNVTFSETAADAEGSCVPSPL